MKILIQAMIGIFVKKDHLIKQTCRAVLWTKLIIDNNKEFFVFNSHYPLSGTSFTRLKCAQIEMQKINKINKITNGSKWISRGDRNTIPKDDTDECNRNHVYETLTSIGVDVTKTGNHSGCSTTWLEFSYDSVQNELNDPERLDFVITNVQVLSSTHHPVGIIDNKIVPLDAYTDEVKSILNGSRFFASDHVCVISDINID